MTRLVRRIVLISLGGRNGQFVILQGTSSGNVLDALYWQLPMGLKQTRFGGQLNNISVRKGNINCTYMFVGIQTTKGTLLSLSYSLLLCFKLNYFILQYFIPLLGVTLITSPSLP